MGRLAGPGYARKKAVMFNWFEFRKVLTGGARELAFQCRFTSLENGVLRLSMPSGHRHLADSFGNSLRDQIGLEKDELRIIIELVPAPKQQPKVSRSVRD